MRISDLKVLHLIKMWLKAPVWEDGKIGGGKKNKIGTPQGGLCKALHNPPYAKQVIMQSKPLKYR
jgi:hypothetical protein